VPTPGQGLGDHYRFFNRMGHHRFHPHGQPQNRNLLLDMRKFQIRLLEGLDRCVTVVCLRRRRCVRSQAEFVRMHPVQ